MSSVTSFFKLVDDKRLVHMWPMVFFSSSEAPATPMHVISSTKFGIVTMQSRIESKAGAILIDLIGKRCVASFGKTVSMFKRSCGSR